MSNRDLLPNVTQADDTSRLDFISSKPSNFENAGWVTGKTDHIRSHSKIDSLLFMLISLFLYRHPQAMPKVAGQVG